MYRILWVIVHMLECTGATPSPHMLPPKSAKLPFGKLSSQQLTLVIYGWFCGWKTLINLINYTWLLFHRSLLKDHYLIIQYNFVRITKSLTEHRSNPNNALLQGKSFNMTINLQCLIPPKGVIQWPLNKTMTGGTLVSNHPSHTECPATKRVCLQIIYISYQDVS